MTSGINEANRYRIESRPLPSAPDPQGVEPAMTTEAKVKECRRCSVCASSDHHWMENSNFGNDPSNPDGEEGYNVEATHVCKHCPALGMEV